MKYFFAVTVTSGRWSNHGGSVQSAGNVGGSDEHFAGNTSLVAEDKKKL